MPALGFWLQGYGHLRQFAYTTHSSGVTLLAMADWILGGYLSQSQPIHWLVIFSQEFELGVMKVRVSMKAVGMGQPFWFTCK